MKNMEDFGFLQASAPGPVLLAGWRRLRGLDSVVIALGLCTRPAGKGKGTGVLALAFA